MFYAHRSEFMLCVCVRDFWDTRRDFVAAARRPLCLSFYLSLSISFCLPRVTDRFHKINGVVYNNCAPSEHRTPIPLLPIISFPFAMQPNPACASSLRIAACMLATTMFIAECICAFATRCICVDDVGVQSEHRFASAASAKMCPMAKSC